jgi:catechol 2,3-dioxygenase-like lactoylglutathione lyase family enzyme
MGLVDSKLEAVVVPVSDVDRSRHFYRALGFHLDGDTTVDAGLRVVRLTPPGSSCSILIGTGLTSAAPGSARGVLKVDDLESARAELEACGAALGPVSRCQTGDEYVELTDPDGNCWLLTA